MGMTRLLAAGALTAANLALSGALLVLAPAVAVADAAPAVVLEASVAERRAVRGRGLADVFEPAELDVLRRFERTRLAIPPGRRAAVARCHRCRLGAHAGEPRPAGAAGPRGAGVRRLSEGRPRGAGGRGRAARPAGSAGAAPWARRWPAAVLRAGWRMRLWRAAGSSRPRWRPTAPPGCGCCRLSGRRRWDWRSATGKTAVAIRCGRPRPSPASWPSAAGPNRRRRCCRCSAERAPASGAGDGTLPPSVLSPDAPVQTAAIDRAERLFLARSFALALIAENRQALGFDRAVEGPRFDAVELPAGITLATVARAAGTSIEVLRGLNPALLRDRVPPQRATTPATTPSGCPRAPRPAAGTRWPA